MQRTWLLLGIGIAIIQIFDIVIHAVSDQLEFLRVASNVVILAWLGITMLGKFRDKLTAFGTIGLYAVLNVLFLMREGFTNPEQGGAPRTMLFILVVLTIGLSALLSTQQKR